MPGYTFSSERVEDLEMFAHRALAAAVEARDMRRYVHEAHCLAWSYAAQGRRLLLFHKAHVAQVDIHLWAADYASRREHEV